ncbi:MAG: hypothetical protein ACK45H_12315, partial [Bacteroidota bacterium]
AINHSQLKYNYKRLFAKFLLSSAEKFRIIKKWRLKMARLVTYKVYYRPVGAWRWRVLKDVLEDGIIDNTEVRFFINKKNPHPRSALIIRSFP